jgi:hypothetical protein
MAMTGRDLTEDNDNEVQEAAAAASTHDLMPARRDLTK